MPNRKDLINELIVQTLNEMFDERIELSSAQYDSVARFIDSAGVKVLLGVLPGGLICNSKLVVCELPNEEDVINRSSSV